MLKEKKYANNELGYDASLGLFCGQADGAVFLKKGDTVILATVVKEKSKEFPGFFPLTVDHREHYASIGKIPGGYFKREGKPSDKEVLTSRIIDRTLRPLFANNYFDKVSIVTTVYSLDKNNLPTELCLVAASLSLLVANIPFTQAAGYCEIARINNKWFAHPTQDQILAADTKITVAGTFDGINMVEGISNGVPEDDLLEALFIAHEEIKKQIIWQKEVIKDFIPNKIENNNEDFFSVEEFKIKANEFLSEDKVEKLFIDNKVERSNYRSEIFKLFLEINKDFISTKDVPLAIIEYAFDNVLQEKLSISILKTGKRVDGRDFNTVRPIKIMTGFLPKAHGSGFFMRGRTQLIVSTTLGGSDDENKIENLLNEKDSAFMLHYNFLPFSVGEARGLRSTSKREVGHGHLAANAIRAVIPDVSVFPYTLRIVADVVESDGSSSMATVCGSIMSLMDAGVPIKEMVAGVAMGMLSSDNSKFEVITDIAGIEDELGLMDFKIAGTENFVTAIQMDIKYKGGLLKNVFKDALEKARIGRLHILSKMKEEMSAPRKNLSSLVPQFVVLNIPKEKIGAVIGSGGKVIREITEKTETSIKIEDSGLVKIFGMPGDNLDKAVTWVKMIAGEVIVGTKFDGIIRKIIDFGCFVELLPGCDGLIHISTIPKSEQESFRNVYKEGDKLKVVVIDYDAVTNRIRLKMVK